MIADGALDGILYSGRGHTQKGSTMSQTLTMPQASTAIERHRHVCVLYDSRDQEWGLLRTFISDGFKHGDKAFHIVNGKHRQDHLRRLEELGIDVAATQATGQLEVRGWEAAHLKPGYFDQHAMLALVDEVLTDSKLRGFPFTRWFANMGWALEDVPGGSDLVEYCARLNYLTPNHEATIVCTFDVAKFSAISIIDVLRTHPAAIIGGMVHENPYFVSTDELLAELWERNGHDASH